MGSWKVPQERNIEKYRYTNNGSKANILHIVLKHENTNAKKIRKTQTHAYMNMCTHQSPWFLLLCNPSSNTQIFSFVGFPSDDFCLQHNIMIIMMIMIVMIMMIVMVMKKVMVLMLGRAPYGALLWTHLPSGNLAPHIIISL